MSKGLTATKDKIYGTQTQQLKNLTVSEYKALRELCFLAKNLYNVGTYNVRQHYFNEGEYLRYQANYPICKENENYQMLNSNMAQQILKEVDGSFKSFFGLIRLAKKGTHDFRSIKLPTYLKKDSFFTLVIGQIRIKQNGILDVPMSPAFKRLYGKVSIQTPSNLRDKKIKEIRIIPKNNARFFEIQYSYEIEKEEFNLTKDNILAIDFGVTNLCTCVASNGDSFIIDGKRLKSVNQWANKENSRLQSIKDKQKITKLTKKQNLIWNKRNRIVNDYINKTARFIINYCINANVGTLVVGYNKTLQRNSNLGASNNQSFVNIPLGRLKDTLEFLCKRYDIDFVKQEESYTSKSDFLADDILPILNVENPIKYIFKGSRISRGCYKSSTGIILNADQNGALNILKKARLESGLKLIENRNIIKQPHRFKIA